jgi:hypothetical protein
MTDSTALKPLAQEAAMSLVAAAANAAGACPSTPDGQSAWLGRVEDLTLGLFRLVPAVIERSVRLAECVAITGVILGVEEIAGRAKITIRPTMGTEPGTAEDLRTAWLSEREGRDMARLATSLVGHHCRFGKRVERQVGNARRTVRMCEWIEEMGPAPEDSVLPAQGAQGTPTGAVPVPPQGLDVVALRKIRPTTLRELTDLAGHRLGLDADSVDAAVLAEIGPASDGPSKTQLLKVWNHLITAAVRARSGNAA